MTLIRILTLLTIAVAPAGASAQETPKGVRLEQHAWVEAEKLLTADTVVVLPLGAALSEHGPHLTLRTDLTLAEYFADRVASAASVVVTPPLTYHFYPAFVEYPGSTSLTLETARDLTIEVARSLARFGPRRFYVLNTGVTATQALRPAAEALAREGILLRFTDIEAALGSVAARVREQEGGAHADEIETSMMLYINPASVDMKRAEKDVSSATFVPPLTRQPSGRGTYSRTGAWGDPTLATRNKGQVIAEALVSSIVRDIDLLRTAALPTPATSTRPAPSRRMMQVEPAPPGDSACLPGVERDIKRIEAAFNASWRNRDYERLGRLWSELGDLVHGDGAIEKGRLSITLNRLEQFKRPEYRSARHVVSFDVVRCLTADIAVVDGRWDLQDVMDAAGAKLPRVDGFLTVVMQRTDGAWLIEAYRYNTKQGAPAVPALQKKPGYPDKR